MSFSSLNHPLLVAGSGIALLVGLPLVSAPTSLLVCKAGNVAAFLVNLTAVSIPGRIDGQQDQSMRQGNLNPTPNESQSLVDDNNNILYSRERLRALVSPAGWAFSIWGPIYLGEAAFCAAQFVPSTGIESTLPDIVMPFIAFNLFQSLWCASFRPSYNEGWKNYISVGMLAGTAYSLSMIQAVQATGWFIPMSMHCGWTTAATLVNWNGSLAMKSSDATVISVGHASAVAATALGMGVTLSQVAPAYGLTVAWALAAVAQGTQRVNHNDSLIRAARVQKMLCYAGSAVCFATSIYTWILFFVV